MKYQNVLTTVIIGLLFGQAFAVNQRPLSVINTLKVGYNDNLYRNTNNETSEYISDVVDLAFRAAFSARTDVMAKSRIVLMDDKGSSEFYPNLYLMLNHTVSPRLLLRLTDYHRSSEKSGEVGSLDDNVRYNYFENRLGGSANYVLTQKDRLEASGQYGIKRHDTEAESLDTTIADVGFSWSRDVIPQRTRTVLRVGERWVEYDNRESSYTATEFAGMIGHTFNQQWNGTLEVGATRVAPDFPAPASNESQLTPLLNVGLVYAPSPQTRLSANLGHSYTDSDDSSYGGQTSTELKLAIQHDLTAKIMAKASARFAKAEYDGADNEQTAGQEATEDRMDLQFELKYRLNRINFLELTLKHSRKERDPGDNWEQNMIELGWRVEIK